MATRNSTAQLAEQGDSNTVIDGYQIGDLVLVKTSDGVKLCRVIDKHEHVNVVYNRKNLEGEALVLCYADKDFNPTDVICKWNGTNCDPLPKPLYQTFIKKTDVALQRMPKKDRDICRVLSHNLNCDKISEPKRKRTNDESTLDSMIKGEGDNVAYCRYKLVINF